MILELLAMGALATVGRALGRFVLGAPSAGDTAPSLLPPPVVDAAPVDEAPTAEGDAVTEPDPDAELHRLDRLFALSATSAALTAVGALGLPMASALAVPCVALPVSSQIWRRWRAWRDDGHVDYGTVFSVASVGLIAVGQFGALGFGLSVFFGGRRVLLATRRRAQDVLRDAFEDWSTPVRVLRDGVEVEVRLDAVEIGEVCVVQAGELIPVDGEVLSGILATDARVFTGESRLVESRPGEAVVAGALVVGGRGTVRTERAGEETMAARLRALIAQTRSYEQSLELRSDTMLDRTIGPTIGMGVLGALARGPTGLVGGVWSNCVDLVWLTAPTAVMVSLRAAARGGILIKDGRSLDELENIDTVVFDKTGTLTRDSFAVRAVHTGDGMGADAILTLAAAAEQRQGHPIARALVEAARAADLDIDGLAVENPDYALGLGLQVEVDGRAVVIGSPRLLGAAGIALDDTLADRAGRAEDIGHTVVHIAVDGRHAGSFELAPDLRPEVVGVLRQLSDRGLKLMILTGDREAPTRRLAGSLGIETWFAETLPEEKRDRIEALVHAGRRVCFVGDGVNDALAMRSAHISVSMAGASTAAVDGAQIVLREGSLQRLDALFELGERHGRVQRRLAAGALLPTAVGFGGVLFGALSVPSVVGVYAVGLAGSMALALNEGRWAPPDTDGEAD